MEGSGLEKAGGGSLHLPLVDGEHHVRFANGSEYYGEFKGGTMSGRGVFVWPNGDVYEGGWQGGAEDGVGAFLAADGSSYYGSWKGGNLHGQGVYKPSGAGSRRAEVVYMREYHDGELLSEAVLRVAEKDVRKKEKKAAKKQAKQTYMPPKPGERIYKGHVSYRLMRELQLGIMFSIAQAGQSALRAGQAGQTAFWQAAGCLLPSIQEEAPREGEELREKDFDAVAVQYFPSGSETEPFKWKDYCPRVFYKLRQAFGIDNRDYLLSITGGAALRELPSPGKSGSVFFLSDDDRYIVKTVRALEMRLLLELIPRYYHHVLANPTTLLVHFYGVHRISPALGRRVRFIVMGNVLPSDLRLHRKYDLKGSTWQRSVGEQRRRSDPDATLKDLDLDIQLVLAPEVHGLVMRQLERDCNLLEELRVMDYSLLLGVHFKSWGNFCWAPPAEDWPDKAPLLGPQKVLGRAHEHRMEAEQAQQEQEDGQGLARDGQQQQQGDDSTQGSIHGPAANGGVAGLALPAAIEEPQPQPQQQPAGGGTVPGCEGEGATSFTTPRLAEAPAGQGASATSPEGEEEGPGAGPPGARPSALWLRRSASEGIRGLLAMLQQPQAQQGEGQEDPGLLKAAAAVVASAQSSRRAARQVAALVSVGAGSPTNVSPDLAAPCMEAALAMEPPPRPSPKELLQFGGAATAAAAAAGGAAANGVDGEEEGTAGARAAGQVAGPGQVSRRGEEAGGAGVCAGAGTRPGVRQRLQSSQRWQSFDSNASSEAGGVLAWSSVDSNASLPGFPCRPAPSASPMAYPLAGLPEWDEVQAAQYSTVQQPQPRLMSRTLTPESPTRQLGAVPGPAQQQLQSHHQQPGPIRLHSQAAAPAGVQQGPQRAQQSSWACGIPLSGWMCAACSPMAVAHETATATGPQAAGAASRQHAWVPLGFAANGPAAAAQAATTAEAAAGGRTVRQAVEPPQTAAQGAAVQLKERGRAAAAAAAVHGTAAQTPEAPGPRVQAAATPVPGVGPTLQQQRLGGEAGSPLSRLSLSPKGPPASVGQGVPALAVRRGGACAPQPVVLYFGIIDFLQEYTVLKWTEHAWKAAVQDGVAVSVTDPHKYRRRFMRAMQDLFVLAPTSPPQQ